MIDSQFGIYIVCLDDLVKADSFGREKRSIWVTRGGKTFLTTRWYKVVKDDGAKKEKRIGAHPDDKMSKYYHSDPDEISKKFSVGDIYLLPDVIGDSVVYDGRRKYDGKMVFRNPDTGAKIAIAPKSIKSWDNDIVVLSDVKKTQSKAKRSAFSGFKYGEGISSGYKCLRDNWVSTVKSKAVKYAEYFSIKFGHKEMDIVIGLLDSGIKEVVRKYGHVALNTDVDGFIGVMTSGRYKSQFETNSSRGLWNPKLRNVVESSMFGSDHNNMEASERPVYGHMLIDGALKNMNVKNYGDIKFVLKDSLKDRSTITGGDSLNCRMYNPVPVPMSDADASMLISPQGGIEGTIRSLKEVGMDASKMSEHEIEYNAMTSLIDIQDESYNEVQVHDGVAVSDIESVGFPFVRFGSGYRLGLGYDDGRYETLIPLIDGLMAGGAKIFWDNDTNRVGEDAEMYRTDEIVNGKSIWKKKE